MKNLIITLIILLIPTVLFAASQSIPVNDSGHHIFTAIGIGHDTPTTDLHVEISSPTEHADLRVYNNDTNGIAHIYAGSNGGGHINLIANSSTTEYLGISANTSGIATEFSDFVFAAGSGGSATERLRIKDSGEIGINDASADYGLEIATTTAIGYFGITNISDGDIFLVDQGGDTTFVNGFADAIGIGTTTFGSNTLLAVEDGTIEWTWNNHQINHSTPGGDTGFIFNQGGLGNFSRFDLKNTDDATEGNRFFSLGFNGDGNPLVIRKGGNVGVGTTTPEHTLSVDGTFTKRGYFHAYNTLDEQLTEGSWDDIVLSTETIRDTEFYTHSNGTVTILQAGTYKVDASVSLNQSANNNRTSGICALEQDGSTIPGTTRGWYSRDNNDGEGSMAVTAIFEAAANDTLNIACNGETGINVFVAGEGASMTIEFIR